MKKVLRALVVSAILDAHLISLILGFWFFFFFLGPHLRDLEVLRLGIQSELQLLAYNTATAKRDPCCICHLHHSSW